MFDLRNPDPGALDLDTIAWALAHIGRYTGHADRFLSIAEHCVHVSLISGRYAREGLLHDAAEAFLGDVSSPLKSILPEYRALENRMEEVIGDRFGLRVPWPAEVKEADYRMLAEEVRRCMPWGRCTSGEWTLILTLPGVPEAEHLGRKPFEAYKFFLNRAEELGLR